MRPLDLYALVTTPHAAAARDFYVGVLGFEIGFESAWFVWLRSPPGPDGRSFSLAFMTPDHPSRPPGPEAFDGRGLILTLQVEDAAAARADVPADAVIYDLADEPWGQRRFMLRDPAGLRIDVVEQTAPADGYWDAYPGPVAAVRASDAGGSPARD